MTDDELLRMQSIVKTFPGVVANDEVDLDVRRGEIHGLLGENGAGKSTLMKILYGLYSPDSGEIWFDGERLDLDRPQDAMDAGIGMVHQHFKLVPRLTVTENIILGRRETATALQPNEAGDGLLEQIKGNDAVKSLASWFTLGKEKPAERIEGLADRYGFDIDPSVPVKELGVGQRQRVEILKALYSEVDLLILDEPTAVLTPTEAERLFETLEELTDDGLSIIFITHKLKEIKAITDRVTVLQEGKDEGTVETADVSRDDLARMMVGRDVLFEIDKDDVSVGDPVLEAENVRAENDRGIEALSGIDLSVHEGEIVGVAGVSGNGQKELAETMAGVRPVVDGTVSIGGTEMTNASPREFIEKGVSFVPEDRHKNGCAGDLSIMHNAAMKEYPSPQFGDGLGFDYDKLEDYASLLVDEFDVRGVNEVTEAEAKDLSGGNLQKLILAREMHRHPDLLVANQPTRGIDVGAIEFVREQLLEQRGEGTGILFFSEDLDELFDLSDRLLVIYEGELACKTTPEQTDRETISMAMNGGNVDHVTPDPSDTGAVVERATDGGRSG
jgi:simple sugar transport system ATP-binding protein